MRWLTLACLAAAATVALPFAASAANKPDPERISYVLVLVVGPDGSKRLELLEGNKMTDRRKKLEGEYAEVYKFWAEGYSEFRKDPANRGKKYPEPQPQKPTLFVKQRSLRGKKKADAALKMWDEKWLQPLLKKEEELRKKMEERSGKKQTDGASAGGGPGEPESKKDLPKGNIVENGGFEDVNPETRFPRSWNKGQWGRKGLSYHVRSDKSNPQAGDHAVSVRVTAEGAKAGVATTLKFPAATYEVRYWASCDIGKSATVGAYFAGKEIGENSVNEDWRQFKQRVAVDKKQFMASFRLWTSTPGVRVFFDEVEVEAVQDK